MSEKRDEKRLRDAVAGWSGKFIHDDDAVFCLRDDCKAGTCDCSVGECGYTIASELDDHIAESIAVLLNGPRTLLDRIDQLEALAGEACDLALLYVEEAVTLNRSEHVQRLAALDRIAAIRAALPEESKP